MKIFFSHSSRDKPLLREIKKNLPPFIRIWMDEDELSVGESLANSLRSGINIETDFVAIFIGPESIKSKWVKQEIEWALQREKELNRLFIIPVLLEKDSLPELQKEIGERIYLLCTDFTKSGVKFFSDRFYDTLFYCYLRLIEEKYHAAEKVKNIDKVERRMEVKKIVDRIFKNEPWENGKINLSSVKGYLQSIVLYLEPMQKLELLLLFEMQKGKFKAKASEVSFENVKTIEITL